MAKHTFEEKLDIVSQVKSGKPMLRISSERHIDKKAISEWVRKYDLYGERDLHKQPNIRATAEFKEEMARLVIEKHLPLSEVVLQYGVSISALESWLRVVRTKGYVALHQQNKRGRPPKAMGKKRDPETELEKLQSENARLRVENALLKKVMALVKKRSPRTHEWAKAMEELRPEHDVSILLDCKQLARSVFYYHRKRLNVDDKYRHEKEEIRRIYHLHKGRYGYRRVTAEMKNLGYKINHKTVQMLMGTLGLRCRIRKIRYHSYKGEVGRIAPNVLKRVLKQVYPIRNGLRMSPR